MPIAATCSGCEKKFEFKDELAGKKVRCNQCKAVIEVPELVDEIEAYEDDSGLHVAFHRDKFLLHQKHFSINTRYSVFDESGEEIMHVVRPTHFFRQLLAAFAIALLLILSVGFVIAALVTLHPTVGDIGATVLGTLGFFVIIAATLFTYAWLAPKRHITFYEDQTNETKLLEVLQDQKIAIRMATYTVRDTHGQEIGRFRKDYLANILRKRWDGFNVDGERFLVIREDSIVLSLLRRFLGSFYGLLRTNFVIHQVDKEGKDGPLLGEFNRKFTLQDKYVLDCSHDPRRGLDRRMAIAIGVLLDTGESR